MTTFIKRYLFDDDKLRDRALLELTRGLRDGRLIALTGAMSTEALGYFSWEGLCRVFGRDARDCAEIVKGRLDTLATTDRQARALIDTIDRHCGELETKPTEIRRIDNRVHFNVIREAFDALEEVLQIHGRTRTPNASGEKPPREEFDERFAARFRTRSGPSKPSPVEPLLQSLGINRFVTLNYDFELERALMLGQAERDALALADAKAVASADPDKGGKFLDYVGAPTAQRQIVRDRINRMSRTNADGMSTESDVLDRERVDRLIEFAVGSANIDRHILHLHGRADLPDSMVVDIRDYDRLYRRDDLFKNPFEHGLRVLFAGNPVLFVGVGMSEGEINATLQDFVSDSPYRRTAPAFLLWNTTRFDTDPVIRAEEKRLKRLDFLQRLGVLVIFDDDLVWKSRKKPHHFRLRHQAAQAALDSVPEEKVRLRRSRQAAVTEIALAALEAMVRELPDTVGKIETFGDRIGDRWRDTVLRAQAKCDRPVRLWGTPLLADAANRQTFVAATGASDARPPATPITFQQTSRDDAVPPAAQSSRLYAGLSKPGFGRGLLAEWIIQNGPTELGPWSFAKTEACDRLLVNAGFSYDSDALLSGIADFLWERGADPEAARPCRELLLASGEAFRIQRPALVVLNGVDRFFGFDGAPLSAELDHLLRCVLAPANAQANVQWLLLGTERLRRYLDTLGQVTFTMSTPAPERRADPEDPAQLVDSKYLEFLVQRFKDEAKKLQPVLPEDKIISPAARAKLQIAHHTGRDAVRRAFFSAYLAPAVLGKFLVSEVAFEILRAMAFIGWPVELHVLLHVPRIAAILHEKASAGTAEDLLLETVEMLRKLALVTEIARFDAESHINDGAPFVPAPVELKSRFGLHRALATELRERHGVPLSEAKLSSTFNMSLFAAQPADDYMPEPQFHDELGNLVDRLIGAPKDHIPTSDVLRADVANALTPAHLVQIANHPGETRVTKAEFQALCTPRAVSCLRAALAVIRGYYSTSNLLSIDRNDRLVSVSRDGALTEHSDRLDRLLTGFGKIASAREIVREIVKAKKLDKALLDKLGPEPFYPDDLVWLHNERGVVKLAQGDLYGARRSFSLALRMNETHLERDHRGHNWRRITLNMIGVLIERGRLRSAETRLDEIEATIDQALWAAPRSFTDKEGVSRGRAWRILNLFGEQSGFIDDCSNPQFTREELLMVGLITGYRGLIGQNRGYEKTAKGLFERSISILRRLGEQRGYALFQRHYASLRQIARDKDSAKHQTELAIAAADAAHQMDMSYRARLLRAGSERHTHGSGISRRQALDDIHRALDYAALTDSYRVRIEASASLARMMLWSGEFDAALKHSCDALAVACRFGHSLHKISLRVQIGEILIQRGDPKSGSALLDQALSLSARIGYQRIVERVQRARRSESAVTGVTDVERA